MRPTSARPSISLTKYSDYSERKITQDLLVSNYLEQCLSQKNSKRQFIKSPGASISNILTSPYASHVSLQEATSDIGYHKPSKQSFGPRPPKKRRPISAPVYKPRRSSKLSIASDGSFFTGSTFFTEIGRRKKPVYKRKHNVLRIQAYVNGSRERPTRVTSNDLSQLLIECTQKLGLTSAARKLFLCDGTPVTSQEQLRKDDEVYVSSGEPFKDPYLSLQEREKLRKSSFWTLNGIMMPSEEANKKSNRASTSVSHRMAQLLDLQKRRILVFKNGESFGGIEIVENRFDEFLDDCTQKLALTSSARFIYDWSGKLIESLSNIPSLDKCLQPNSGPVLGPLWVSKGERFSPKGAHSFLNTMVHNTKERIGSTQEYLQNLCQEMEIKVSYFSKEEILSEISQEQMLLESLEQALPTLQELLSGLNKKQKEEDAFQNPSAYKFQHISEIDSNSRLLVLPALKIQLYINGHKRDLGPVKVFINVNDLKKASKSKAQTMQKFFDTVSANVHVATLFGITTRKVYVKRAFALSSKEIVDIDMLSQNQELWLSLGESFIPVEYPVTTLNIEKVKLLSLWGWKQIVQRDVWMGCDENQTSSKLWQVLSNIPPQCETQEMKVEMPNQEKVVYLHQCNEERLHQNRPYLQLKQDHNLVLHPEIIFETKGSQNSDGNCVWGRNIQKWIVNQDGTISNKHFKSLVVGVIDKEIHMLFKDENGKEELLEGALVGLRVKNNNSLMDNQFNGQFCHWEFTTDGYIQPTAFPEYVLTAVNGFSLYDQQQQTTTTSEEVSEEEIKGHWEIKARNDLIVTQHESSSSSSSNEDEEGDEKDNEKVQKGYNNQKQKTDQEETQQQEATTKNFNPFADIKDVFKGEKATLIILPKFPQNHQFARNQRWAFKSTSDGISPSNTIPEKWAQQNLTWPCNEHGQMCETPVEGYLTYGVPKLKWKIRKYEDALYSTAKNDGPVKLRALRNGESDTARAVIVLAPDAKISKKDTELHQFLERCTEALNLPFAARRIFTSDGKEMTSLSTFEKNDLVYISCGEAWNNPLQSHAGQQRRILLANLAGDIAKIKRYIALQNCNGFILKAGISHRDMQVCLMKVPTNENPSTVHEEKTEYGMMDPAESDEEETPMTSHQKTHAKLDSKPKEVNRNGEDAPSDGRQTVTHREALFGSGHVDEMTSSKQECTNRWAFYDGFVQLKTNPNYVIGIAEANANVDVVVCKKNSEDSNQRWQIQSDGTVSLVSNPSLVLTVATPTLKNDSYFGEELEDDLYDEARLIITNRKNVVNGNANQIFWFDEESGYIYAFATDEINSELTAANLASICSYSVFGETAIYQPGYFFKRNEDGKKNVYYLCEACGRAVRGKQKLQRVVELAEFSCCIGKAKRNKLKLKGAFQCLGNKIDLSRAQVETTLQLWEDQLQRLRAESSVRAIASAITVTQNNPAVRLLARRNGEGCGNRGVVVIGNTLPQILDDCTQKLKLPHAARRLYTMDGELITNMQQLLKPYYPELTYMRNTNQSKSSGNVLSKSTNENWNKSGDEAADVDDIETVRMEKLDVRVPIDVWVSMSEPFVPLDEVEKVEILSKYELHEKDEAIKSLQIQKHRLRQAKGRRISGYKDDNGDAPLRRAWRTQADSEHLIETSIDRLQNELEEVKIYQKDRAKSLNMIHTKEPSTRLIKKMQNMKLYQIPRAIKLHVFPNGESPQKSCVIFARNFQEVLNNATNRLVLTSCARRVFTPDGIEIFDMERVVRDETLCVTSGERFVPFKERRSQLELKAAYARVNRNFKADLTDYNNNLTVQSPMLALPSTIRSESNSHRKDAFIHVFHEEEKGSKTSVLSRRPKSARVKFQPTEESVA